jgi:hypothetical protein
VEDIFEMGTTGDFHGEYYGTMAETPVFRIKFVKFFLARGYITRVRG